MSDLWYYSEGETTNGPLSSEELVVLLKQKPGIGDTFVWQQGFSDWVQASSVPELARLLMRPTPPPRKENGRSNQQQSAEVSVAGKVQRPPIWPLIAAPFAGFIYYFLLRFAFIQSIEGTFGAARISDGLNDLISQPNWGTHWIYRGVAEYLSITIAVFVAGGLARGRALLGAVVGACTISLFYIIRFGLLYRAWQHPADWVINDPWYQYVIDGILIFAAPVIAISTAEHIEEAHRKEAGLAGINRWHFLWLWIPTYLYALAMITPLVRFYSVQMEGGIFALFMVVLVHAVPTFVVAVPLYYGLLILRGDHGDTMPPAARNFVGALVLIGGLVVGIAVQTGWYWTFNKIGEAISG